jgi:glucan phosphoethanolaminetransferase (alkaline phosphatase superfamily)
MRYSPLYNKNIFSQGKFDISMLDNLISYIDNQKSDVLVVLHSLGSHGPK